MSLPRRPVFAAYVAAAVLVGGCSGVGPEGNQLAKAPDAPAQQNGASAGGYQLTAEERALDCKKLTGRMQVRILQNRGFDASKGQGSGFGSMFGVKSPTERNAQDRAQLQAYNAALSEKKCPTFDLTKELQQQDMKVTPRPAPAAKTQPGEAEGKKT
jgi:hypothetical protein